MKTEMHARTLTLIFSPFPVATNTGYAGVVLPFYIAGGGIVWSVIGAACEQVRHDGARCARRSLFVIPTTR